MAEVLTPATPITWTVQRLVLERSTVPTASRIQVKLLSTLGASWNYTWEGAVADALLIALNKANLSVKSLNTRVLEQLANDGVMPGAVTGVAD